MCVLWIFVLSGFRRSWGYFSCSLNQFLLWPIHPSPCMYMSDFLHIVHCKITTASNNNDSHFHFCACLPGVLILMNDLFFKSAAFHCWLKEKAGWECIEGELDEFATVSDMLIENLCSASSLFSTEFHITPNFFLSATGMKNCYEINYTGTHGHTHTCMYACIFAHAEQHYYDEHRTNIQGSSLHISMSNCSVLNFVFIVVLFDSSPATNPLSHN